MKHLTQRACALMLALTLALTLFPVTALAAGSVSYDVTTQLGPGLTLTQTNSRTDAGVYRQSFALDYAPGQAVTPLVLYGSTLYGKSDVQTVTAYAQSLGYNVLAAVNSDYFFTGSGVPTGMTIQNGRLCTSDGNWNAVGFFADGSAMAGAPRLKMTMTLPSGASRGIYALNNVRTAAGVYLYTTDFDTATRTTAEGTEVVLELLGDSELRLGKTLSAMVLRNTNGKNTPILPGQMVLSATAANASALADLAPGDVISIDAVTDDPAWEQVLWATGGGNMLVKGGQMAADVSNETAPRTILGVRADGSVYVLEYDGRQSGVSAGLSTREAAQILLDQGCVSGINLDGGGSSVLSAAYPGQTVAVQSSPSDGKPRACATYILFVNQESSSGRDYGSVVYPRSATLLPGGKLNVSALSYDRNFVEFENDTGRLRTNGGTVEDGVYTAPDSPGVYTVESRTGRSQAAEYTVVQSPASLRLSMGGKAVTSLALERGQTVDLNVLASDGVRSITCQDEQFYFSVSGDIGTIDAQGVLTTGRLSGSGSVTVSYAGVSCTIPVTVSAKEAAVLDGFETLSVTASGTAQAEAALETGLDHVRFGKGALKLTYTPAVDTDAALYQFNTALDVSTASHLSLMAKGSGGWYLIFRLADGTNDAVPFTPGADWTLVTTAVPQGALSLLGFACQGGESAQVRLDGLCAHFGDPGRDLTPPVITITQTQGALKATLSDASSLRAENLSVLIDGKEASFAFQSGQLTCALPQDNALHRVTILARDSLGNLSRKSAEVGTAPATAFSDMNGHWAATPVEYLHQKGVFSDAPKFDPSGQVTTAMAATILSRYLGVDVSQYAAVTLPYTDQNQIPAWALDHVKAMYALGIMQGSKNNKGQSVLNPNALCSRAQIMTILGRTLERGYAYSPCAYDDTSAIPGWSRDHIDLLSALGIVTGNKGKVNPTGTITRAELAALLYRLY